MTGGDGLLGRSGVGIQWLFGKRKILCSWNSVHAWNGGMAISWCSAFQWPAYWLLFVTGVIGSCVRATVDACIYVGRGRLTPPISRIVLCSVVSSSVSHMMRPREGIATGWCTVFAIICDMMFVLVTWCRIIISKIIAQFLVSIYFTKPISSSVRRNDRFISLKNHNFICSYSMIIQIQSRRTIQINPPINNTFCT